MNLRQRYKKAKQKIALLEKQPVVRNFVRETYEPIKKCGCSIEVNPWEMEHPEIIMQEIGNKMMKEVTDCIRVESTLDKYTGKVVIRASLRVIREVIQ